jgi:hypothetical protein
MTKATKNPNHDSSGAENKKTSTVTTRLKKSDGRQKKSVDKRPRKMVEFYLKNPISYRGVTYTYNPNKKHPNAAK